MPRLERRGMRPSRTPPLLVDESQASPPISLPYARGRSWKQCCDGRRQMRIGMLKSPYYKTFAATNVKIFILPPSNMEMR